jgi:hypothetical protein
MLHGIFQTDTFKHRMLLLKWKLARSRACYTARLISSDICIIHLLYLPLFELQLQMLMIWQMSIPLTWPVPAAAATTSSSSSSSKAAVRSRRKTKISEMGLVSQATKTSQIRISTWMT